MKTAAAELDFEAILAMMAEIARSPVFPVDEIDRRRLQAITSKRLMDHGKQTVHHLVG